MKDTLFKTSIALVGLVFTLIFCFLIIPPFMENPDIIWAFAQGFVNPFATGYSIDVICCWIILFLWVLYESPKVKFGWLALLLGIVPGVAVGFALYLLLRTRQVKNLPNS